MKEARPGFIRALALSRLREGAAALLAVGFLVHTLAGVDIARVSQLVGSARGWVALGLAPYVLAVVVDAGAGRVLLGRFAQPAPTWGRSRVCGSGVTPSARRCRGAR